jgi:hypothetical protein
MFSDQRESLFPGKLHEVDSHGSIFTFNHARNHGDSLPTGRQALMHVFVFHSAEASAE